MAAGAGLAAGVAATLLIGAAGGAALGVLPFSALLVLPLLLLGMLMGEVLAATAGRPGGGLLALMGLLSALSGVVVGRGSVNASALGPLEVLLILAAAAIAGLRAGTSRP